MDPKMLKKSIKTDLLICSISINFMQLRVTKCRLVIMRLALHAAQVSYTVFYYLT